MMSLDEPDQAHVARHTHITSQSSGIARKADTLRFNINNALVRIDAKETTEQVLFLYLRKRHYVINSFRWEELCDKQNAFEDCRT